MLLLLFSGGAAAPEPPDSSTPPDPFSFFVDRVPDRITFDIPRDDEEVLLMFAQFVVKSRVH